MEEDQEGLNQGRGSEGGVSGGWAPIGDLDGPLKVIWRKSPEGLDGITGEGVV